MLYKILIFESSHKVLKADKVLTEGKIKFDIIPTPKEFSSDCGLAIRMKISDDELQKAETVLKENDLTFTIHNKEMK
jgi:hypothetical protein